MKVQGRRMGVLVLAVCCLVSSGVYAQSAGRNVKFQIPQPRYENKDLRAMSPIPFTASPLYPTLVPGLPPNTGVRVCAAGGVGGGNGKVCIGTDGISSTLSAGAGISGGVSTTRGWNGETSTCATISGTAGGGLMGTGSASVCRDSRGREFTQVSGGGGVGIGTEGWQLGVTVEGTLKNYGPQSAPVPPPYQMRGTRTDIAPPPPQLRAGRR